MFFSEAESDDFELVSPTINRAISVWQANQAPLQSDRHGFGTVVDV